MMRLSAGWALLVAHMLLCMFNTGYEFMTKKIFVPYTLIARYSCNYLLIEDIHPEHLFHPKT
jgi:hypothetical protein